MQTSQHRIDPDPDVNLIKLVRAGQTDAYAKLFERHVDAAYHHARQLSRDRAVHDDLVAESFTKVLAQLHAGRGPDTSFRAYLLTTMRHTAYGVTRNDRKLRLFPDVSNESSVDAKAVTVPFADSIIARTDRLLAAKAFNGLPKPWRRALAYTVIDGMEPAQAAPLLGLTPNGASALAYRARMALCALYLQAHLNDIVVAEPCRATFPRLGARARDIASGDKSPSVLSSLRKRQVDTHLETCDSCRFHVQELIALSPRVRRPAVTRRPCTRRNPLPSGRRS